MTTPSSSKVLSHKHELATLEQQLEQAIQIFNESDKLFLGFPIGYNITITEFKFLHIDNVFDTVHYNLTAKVNYPEYDDIYIVPDCVFSVYIHLNQCSIARILSTVLYPRIDQWLDYGRLDDEKRLANLKMTLRQRQGDYEVVDIDKHISVAHTLLSTLKRNICSHSCDTYINNGDVGVDAADLIKAQQALIKLNIALKNIKEGDTITEEENLGIRVSSTPLHIWEKS